MIHIVKYLKKKLVPVSTFTFLYEDGRNKLQEFYESLEVSDSSDELGELDETESKIHKCIMVDSSEDKDEAGGEKKKEPDLLFLQNYKKYNHNYGIFLS